MYSRRFRRRTSYPSMGFVPPQGSRPLALPPKTEGPPAPKRLSTRTRHIALQATQPGGQHPSRGWLDRSGKPRLSCRPGHRPRPRTLRAPMTRSGRSRLAPWGAPRESVRTGGSRHPSPKRCRYADLLGFFTSKNSEKLSFSVGIGRRRSRLGSVLLLSRFTGKAFRPFDKPFPKERSVLRKTGRVQSLDPTVSGRQDTSCA
jgi:hypothetical protein